MAIFPAGKGTLTSEDPSSWGFDPNWLGMKDKKQVWGWGWVREFFMYGILEGAGLVF